MNRTEREKGEKKKTHRNNEKERKKLVLSPVNHRGLYQGQKKARKNEEKKERRTQTQTHRQTYKQADRLAGWSADTEAAGREQRTLAQSQA